MHNFTFTLKKRVKVIEGSESDCGSEKKLLYNVTNEKDSISGEDDFLLLKKQSSICFNS